MSVDIDDLGDDEILGAVAAELQSSRRLLPAESVYPALVDKQAEFAQWVGGRLGRRFIPSGEETVSVSKGGHGIRPVAIWDIPTRVGYRALAARLANHLPPLARSRDHWKQFRRAPTGSAAKYIVATDIAACYQNLDHGLLAEELLVQTGDHRTVEMLIELTAQASGRTYGLPQQSWASDVLAETFMARLERSLVRCGLVVHRYNDDFLFSCDSWSEAIRSIEVFEEETRRIGLGVNDLKTITWKADTYESQLNDADALRDEIASEAEFDLAFFYFDPYSDEEGLELPDAGDVDVAASLRILERWVEVASSGQLSDDSTPSEYRALVELLPSALSVLSDSGQNDPTVLRTCGDLLRFERTLTPSVARYLSSCDDEDEVLRGFDALLSDGAYLSSWQTWWLQQPVARATGFASGAGADARLEWLRSAFESAGHTPVLRAEVARSLAAHGHLQAGDLLSLYDRSSNIVRPILVAALALIGPNAHQRQSVVGDSKLHEWVYEWAAPEG